jgi:hypothetical protein
MSDAQNRTGSVSECHIIASTSCAAFAASVKFAALATFPRFLDHGKPILQPIELDDGFLLSSSPVTTNADGFHASAMLSISLVNGPIPTTHRCWHDFVKYT